MLVRRIVVIKHKDLFCNCYFSIPSRPPYNVFVLVVIEQPLAILSGLMSVTGVGGNTGTLWEG